MQWKWTATDNGSKSKSSKWYAVRTERVGGKQRRIYMHREVCQPGPGLVADHFPNPDGLDNRRCNLRAITQGKNAFGGEPQRWSQNKKSDPFL